MPLGADFLMGRVKVPDKSVYIKQTEYLYLFVFHIVTQEIGNFSKFLKGLEHRDQIYRGRKGHKNQFLAYV